MNDKIDVAKVLIKNDRDEFLVLKKSVVMNGKPENGNYLVER